MLREIHQGLSGILVPLKRTLQRSRDQALGVRDLIRIILKVRLCREKGVRLAESARLAAEGAPERLRLDRRRPQRRSSRSGKQRKLLPWLEKMSAVKRDLRRALRARGAVAWHSASERAEVLTHFGGTIPRWLQWDVLPPTTAATEEWQIRACKQISQGSGWDEVHLCRGGHAPRR